MTQRLAACHLITMGLKSKYGCCSKGYTGKRAIPSEGGSSVVHRIAVTKHTLVIYQAVALSPEKGARAGFKRKGWTLRELKLLGTKTDAELARLLNRSVSSIRTERWRNNIPQKDPVSPWWTKAEDKLLGTMSDEEVVKKLGRPLVGVRHRRRKLRILFQKPWSIREDRLLGTMTDEKLAKKLNRTLLSVSNRRAQKGIPKIDSKLILWTKAEVRLLGKLSDEEVAKMTGRKPSAVLAHRKILKIPKAK